MALLLAAAGTEDPRQELIDLQILRDTQAALETVEKKIQEDPTAAGAMGLEYLRGHLLLEMDRRKEAIQAFATSMSATPSLGPYSRYRMALEQERMEHPEVAAGLAATLLAGSAPRTLVLPTLRLLRRTLAQGGDCRVLRGLSGQGLRTEERRQLSAARIYCARKEGDGTSARKLSLELLEADRGDEVARFAAETLAALEPDAKSARFQLLLGLTFYNHREFELSSRHLSRTLELLPGADLTRREIFECRYALARSYFWLGRHLRAAADFGALAASTSDRSRKAQVLYQQARSYELGGVFDKAAAVFQLVYEAEPSGRWSDAALIAFMRLQWILGNEELAEQAHKALGRSHPGTFARASLFLACSDLVQGKADRAGDWLAAASRTGRLGSLEKSYWQGRLDELEGRAVDALGHYVQAIRESPYHPLAKAARTRLASDSLRAAALRQGIALAGSSRPEELHAAWILLGDDDPRGQNARAKLLRSIAADSNVREFLELEGLPTASWPLWRSSLQRPEDLLLALGIFELSASEVLRHFPVGEPRLAYTGSLMLSRSGETQRSLYIAEVLEKRTPRRLPEELVPEAQRRLLYPFGYSYLILREASRSGIDPYLLAGIIREESRFDPHAFSSASARGLTQFVFPTAREVAEDLDIAPLVPEDLERPEIAIALGAGYLRKLGQELGGATERMVAAYNAGTPPASLWRSYCFSDEPEEYLSKVAFPETRNYLSKVLTSRNQYTDLYSPPSVSRGVERPAR